MPGKKGMTGKGLGGHRPGAGRKPILRDTPQTTTILLRSSLPCSIRADAPGGICGKPATAAYAWPQEPAGDWPTPGLWTLQPVCAECAKAAAEVYREAD